MEISGRVALVTGGARRLGKEIALHLASLGADIAINCFSSVKEAEETRGLIEGIGRKAYIFIADVSKPKEVGSMVRGILEVFERIDILINNSAIFYKTDFLTLSESDWDSFMNVNLKGAFLCSQEVAKHFLSQGYGKIINIADVGGVRAWKGYTPYCVSKAGLIMLTKCMAKALAPFVQVNAVAPGPVLLPEGYTERESAIEGTLLKREGSPLDVAKAVQFLIETDYTTGEVVFVDGGSRLV
jgi:NAD(P)-dependent dehydrogenase (short-subunit alcohol dehydrogenase family)